MTSSGDDPDRCVRPTEESVRTDLAGRRSYGRYLDLDRLLGVQHPVSTPEHHDELLFIVQHQTSELWLQLMLDQLRAARAYLAPPAVGSALKRTGTVIVACPPLIRSTPRLTLLPPAEPPLAALQTLPADAAQLHGAVSVAPAGSVSVTCAAVTGSGPALLTVMT